MPGDEQGVNLSRTARKDRGKRMHVAVALSEGQANLIRRLIEIAKNNRLFSAEFEGDLEACEQLQGLAEELTKQFSLSQEGRRNIMVPIKSSAAAADTTTTENGKPWWDISSVKLGLPPDQLRQQLRELSEQVRSLVFYSDSLEVRQILLEAFYLLHSADAHGK